jgi:hypothetical protein
MSWILIFHIYTSPLQAIAINTNAVPGFTSERSCRDAGIKVEKMINMAGKNLTFVCVASESK